MDLALTRRNPATNRFDIEWDSSGNPIFDDLEEHRVASLLIEHRGQWAFDPDGRRGSTLYQLRTLKRSTPSAAQAAASEALAKAITDGAITSVDISARVERGGRLRIFVSYAAPARVEPVRLALVV